MSLEGGHLLRFMIFVGSAVQFDNAHASAGLCGPSRASMLSGRKPQSLNYYQHRLKVGKKAVDREITTYVRSIRSFLL